jgi:gamma-glutamyl-gamma-aminobutyrate hydrolase PuuD
VPEPRSARARPRIGITYSYAPGEAGVVNDNVAEYVRAVAAAGGEAVLLLNDARRVDEYAAELDGVVLSGGTDVDPAYYGKMPDPKTQPADCRRDVFEVALVKTLRERAVPTLCVCRGLQVANVAFGGSLVQDLPSEFGERYTLKHHQVKEDGLERADYLSGHDVCVEPESALAALVGSTSFPSNSMHHQAVLEVAPALRAVAWSPDGVIEALDAAFEHPFFYAVQWHPEELHDDPISGKLFRGLVEASSERGLRGV